MRGVKNLLPAALVAISLSASAAEKAAVIGDTENTPPGTVTVFPISNENRDLYTYEPHEYWIKGTDIVREFSIADASEFYSILFELVHTKFARPVSYEYIVNRVLDALSVFAGRISVTTASSRILVHDKSLKLLGNFNKPDDEDGRAWSNLLVNIILALRENNEKVRGAHPEQIYHLSATYLLKSLDDNALYTDPVTAEKDREGYNSTGAGFTYRHVEGGIQVLSIIRNSPAFFSPLAEGDVITHINSKKVAEITPELLEATLISNNTAILHFNYITYIMNQPAEAYIRKDKIIMPSVTADASVPGIPVVAIRDFRQGAARELKAAIDGLDRASMKGLVIDLRAATGGEFSEAMEAANLFIDGGELLKTKRHDGRGGSLYSAKEGDMLSGLPVAVIADNSTKGYPEAFAFALAERKRAVLLGTPTFGMGTVEETFDINKNRKATFATSLVFSPEGAALNGIGVAPLVCLSSFKATGDADKFVRNAKAGRFKDNRMKLAEPTKDDIETLRKSCPAVYPTMEMQALPITIAAKILEDKEAYGKLADMM